jgi:hypothetical protein
MTEGVVGLKTFSLSASRGASFKAYKYLRKGCYLLILSHVKDIIKKSKYCRVYLVDGSVSI